MVTCGYLPTGELWVNAKGHPVPVHLHLGCWDRAPTIRARQASPVAPQEEEPVVEPVRPGGADAEQQTMF